jgi:cardiolipin synthase
VQIIVPGISDSSLVLYASQSRYGELLESGVKICEAHSSVLHAKTAVIDGVWSTVGSSNLDYRSFLHNDEVNAIVLGTGFADQMEAQFLQDLGDCKVITLQQWHDRPLLDRVREFFSWTVEYWL